MSKSVEVKKDVQIKVCDVDATLAVLPDRVFAHIGPGIYPLEIIAKNPFGGDLPFWATHCNNKKLGLVCTMWKKHAENGNVTIIDIEDKGTRESRSV